ncbi:MAG TPA: OmpA family protein [Kofleriaceae bacterium]|jgi:outer membrane protein OmpA-like peptidoglycan-associated protein
MSRAALALIAVLVPSIAHADPLELGGFLGPRLFSDKSDLGFIDGAPAHPMLQNSVAFGGRIAHEFFVPWFFPEIELAFSPTHTDSVGGAPSATVYWLDPRVQLRFELLPGRRVQPFVLVGAGAPTSISTARMTLNSGIIAEGYAGVGVRLDTLKGFRVRIDARVSVITGENPPPVGVEAEFDFGIDFGRGGPPRPSTTEVAPMPTAEVDTDGDGIPDSKDKCPTRPEDFDGFEDADGCPDIDNDGDHVLDIADKCPMQPETYNGFEDDDGCPDTVPPDVTAIEGSIEGLLYADGETAVRDSAEPAIKKIAKVMSDHPGVKIVLVGHTDDREAKAFATPPAEGQPPPDVDALATELAHGRAEAVKQSLVAAGVPEGRIVVDGVGAEDPVADNSTPKGRLANRRVELKLFVAHY